MEIVTAIFSIFTAFSEWFVELLPNLTSLFWVAGNGTDPGTLTFLGVTAVISIGIGLVLLCFNILKDFIKFRS